MNTIAKRIKFAMEVKNKKQIEIVRDTGISKGAFSSYLSGLYSPKMDKLQLIADSLDVDVKWLSGENVPMQATPKQSIPMYQYVFYNNSCSEYLLDNSNDIYIAMMTEYAALVPRFYVIVNPSTNVMDMLPIFLKKDSNQFYECPSAFFNPGSHSTFTKDFDSINMYLKTSIIYYYGIDIKTYQPKVTQLTYSPSKDCYQITDSNNLLYEKGFLKELEKESLYLKNTAK